MAAQSTNQSVTRTPSAGGNGSRPTVARGSLGPLADLEAHLPEEWWRQMFDSLYLMTDGDVVENNENTKAEIDILVDATGITPDSRILDLCCGQGRHVLELARRGFGQVTGFDRSRFLIRLARRRARTEGLSATFKEGDARNVRLPEASLDLVAVMGNSFGYFSSQEDDAKVLASIAKILAPTGKLALDLADGAWVLDHYEPRSWEWIDQHHFVCRERHLSKDKERLICREVVVHDERGVIADQFYAERLYTKEGISKLLRSAGFREIRFHANIEARSNRAQDLGMMAHRMFVTAATPERVIRKGAASRAKPIDVTVLLGDPRLPDEIKRGGQFNEEDHQTVQRLRDALDELPGYNFRYLDNHGSMIRDLREQAPGLVLNFCDEGWNNDAFMELHVPALLELMGFRYTGAGPACLGLCYDKALVRSVAQSLDIPVPLETYIRPGDQSATLPSTFPAILKPNFGDSSFGITKDAVVSNSTELVEYIERMRDLVGDRPILVQEFLTGEELTVALIGNPETGLTTLPILSVDYSGLPGQLPPILGYESKWEPDSPYWTQIRYRACDLPAEQQRILSDHAARLFERLQCRDYARFDFRADKEGTVKLLEVNPNPGWCWDGKMNLMAEMNGWSYVDFLQSILDSALERIGLQNLSGQADAVLAVS